MFVHRFPLRVYYEDTDTGGVVYHASYLRFADRARSEMLRDMGFDYAALLKQGISFVVRKVDIDYQRPAVLDDKLEVHSTVMRVSGARFDLRQTILRGKDVICDIALVLVCMSVADFKPARLPENLRKLLMQQQEQQGETLNV